MVTDKNGNILYDGDVCRYVEAHPDMDWLDSDARIGYLIKITWVDKDYNEAFGGFLTGLINEDHVSSPDFESFSIPGGCLERI